jgi:hypothetical protein
MRETLPKLSSLIHDHAKSLQMQLPKKYTTHLHRPQRSYIPTATALGNTLGRATITQTFANLVQYVSKTVPFAARNQTMKRPYATDRYDDMKTLQVRTSFPCYLLIVLIGDGTAGLVD